MSAETVTKRSNVLTEVDKHGYTVCLDCGGLVERESEWLGEDATGRGRYKAVYMCEDCGRWVSRYEYE